MKILVIQLARLGDIFLMWPALRALRRANPEAHIEVLTRAKFVEALEGLTEIDKVRILPTKDLIEPLFGSQIDIKSSYERVDHFLQQLREEKYDWILNYTFSPVSSYITHAISYSETKVCGYTRHADGFLSIPDDLSAYFYAQVGIHRANRYHLCEIFATMASVDLIADDFKPPKFGSSQDFFQEFENKKDRIAIHIGASEKNKSISPEKWIAFINQYLKLSQDNIVLIGAPNETVFSDKIISSTPSGRVQSLVGKTKVSDLFSVLKDVKVLVGPDSAPQHIASLVSTPCLNISVGGVNFWETGPRAPKSCVVKIETESEIAADKLAQILHKMRTGQNQSPDVITVVEGTPSFWALASPESEFQWNLIEAIYTGKDFPASTKKEFIDGMEKLADINQLMIEQMEILKKGGDIQIAAGIIENGEEIIQAIARLVPSLGILIRWYQTEKVRLGPEDYGITLNKSLEIHKTLAKLCEIYREYQENYQQEKRHELIKPQP